MSPEPNFPVPQSVSEQAQAWLASAPPYGDGDMSTLADTDAWLEFIEARDAHIARIITEQVPADLPVVRDEIAVDGVTTFVLRPEHVADDLATPLYLDIHGGGLIFGGGETCAAMAAPYALARNMITWSVDYRMPPLHPYPAGLDDCLTVYRRALEERPPEHIVVGGASAGGNLAAASLFRARDEGLPMPAALVLLSPEVDLTESGDSFETHRDVDHVLSSLMEVNRLYAGGEDLADPYLSPLFGDVSGFPPTFLQCGTRDLFLSNTVRMHRTLRDAGVDAELHVWEAMPHGGFGGAPEDIEVVLEVSKFLERHVSGPATA